MKLYNSLSQRIELLRTEGNQARMYICGITPYDTTHLGHAFTYSTFDILIRYLELQGKKVTYVQNVTDIDDDILRKAREVEDDWRSLGDRWTAHYIRDMQLLNVRPPDYYPRASEVIPEIIAMIEELLRAGKAYTSNGNVYYDVDAWPEFGQLSHLPREEMLPIANERGNNPSDPYKRDPLDFVLWQAQAPGEPAWLSPWGAGRPGWHIECSAMSTSYLGNTIDIHSGGADLVFPHHECEIAQVEPINGKRPFVQIWMHVAMVRYQGEKMSKSLGNLVMVRDLLKTWTPDAIRLYLARHHYRDSWSYDEGELNEANELSERFREAVTITGGRAQPLDPDDLPARFHEAMENDLDTPMALSVLSEWAGEVLAAALAGLDVGAVQAELRSAAGVFGLRLDAEQPEPRVLAGWNEHLRKFE